MNKQEFAVLADAIRSYYPRENIMPTKESASLWYEELKDIDAGLAMVAVKKYVQTNKWAPTIADIRENVVDVTAPKEDWSSGWEQVIKAIGRYGYYNEHEALESMDEITRTATKRLGWKMICQSEQTDLTAIRANFRMIYEQIQQDAKTDAKLSDELKAQMEQITGKRIKRLLI